MRGLSRAASIAHIGNKAGDVLLQILEQELDTVYNCIQVYRFCTSTLDLHPQGGGRTTSKQPFIGAGRSCALHESTKNPPRAFPAPVWVSS